MEFIQKGIYFKFYTDWRGSYSGSSRNALAHKPEATEHANRVIDDYTQIRVDELGTLLTNAKSATSQS